jgi:hypothetical protein
MDWLVGCGYWVMKPEHKHAVVFKVLRKAEDLMIAEFLPVYYLINACPNGTHNVTNNLVTFSRHFV